MSVRLSTSGVPGLWCSDRRRDGPDEYDGAVAAAKDESIPALKDTLAQATDDRERAGLHDAIAIQLSRGGRLEEALEENTRAVALREELARGDPRELPLLAVSLSNQGGHLTALERYDDAIVSHLRALEIQSQLDWSAPQSLARLAFNASRLGALLSRLNQPALAARFDGLSLTLYQALAKEDSDYRARAASQLNALCLSLDRAALPAPALPAKLDRERLLAAAKPSSCGGELLEPMGGSDVPGTRPDARRRSGETHGRVLRPVPRGPSQSIACLAPLGERAESRRLVRSQRPGCSQVRGSRRAGSQALVDSRLGTLGDGGRACAARIPAERRVRVG